MKLLFSGDVMCNQITMKRLFLIAEEIAFMDRPSVTFENWGTIGSSTPARRIDSSDSPVKVVAFAPPSGPATELYRQYIEADLSNPVFVSTLLEGLSNDPVFASKFIQAKAKYGLVDGDKLLKSVLADEKAIHADLSAPLKPKLMFHCDTHEERVETLKVLVYVF